MSTSRNRTGLAPTNLPNWNPPAHEDVQAFGAYRKSVLNSFFDQASSAAAARRDFEDNAATVESWANMSAWTLGSAGVLQATAGRVFSNGAGGAASGANRAFSLSAGENMRAVFTYRHLTGGASGGAIVGVNSDAAGAVPAAAGGASFGLYFRAFNPAPQQLSNGAFTDIAGAPALRNNVDYVITVTVDQQWISVVARSTDGNDEIRTRRARGGFSVNNLYLFNSDTRGAAGLSFGPLGVRKQFGTISPRSGIEGLGYTTHWSGDGTNNFKLTLPPAYDSRVPVPVVVMFHGNGSDETHFSDNGNGKAAANALIAAGFATITASAASTTTWGSDSSLNAYVAAYRFFRDRYSLGAVMIYGNSMGALESLLAIADGRIPGVAGWAATHPALSLSAAYKDHFEIGFAALIRSSYGISADGSDYAVKTSGHDPLMMDPRSSFRAVPMWILYATDDVAVDQNENAQPFVQKVRDAGMGIDVTTVTGGHYSSIAAYTASIVSFFRSCIGR